jgi:hypothetical protein
MCTVSVRVFREFALNKFMYPEQASKVAFVPLAS